MIVRVVAFLCLATSTIAFAQDKDTTHRSFFDRIQQTRISKEIMHSVTATPSDGKVLNAKSEDIFMPYEGRIIRHITINHIGFDKTIYDTTRTIKNTVTRIGNALHTNTRPWVIRDNLFIREGKPVNPYQIADNERYLRDLDFILDARIKLIRVGRDSVDVIIVTRDVFSLGASFNPSNATKYKFKVRDTNIAGWGQGFQVNGLVQQDRNPKYGGDYIYTKNSVGGTLTNLSVGLSTLNNGSSYGTENEYAAFIKLDRPLVSPYSRLAGGMEFSTNWAKNVFSTNDSIFLNYKYLVKDFWIGYNIGVNSSIKNRNRHFIALRTFQQKFSEKPIQAKEYDPIYNNITYILGQFTFFNQNFYKTQYIFGFGRTEDVPYGTNISVLAGWANQASLHRPYAGFDFEKSVVHPSGDFFVYSFRAEGFKYKSQLQDISLLVSAARNSRLYEHPRVKVRQSNSINYSAIINPTINQLLMINNDFGISGFKADSIKGVQRLSVHSETVLFTNWNLLGFKFAPVVFADIAFVAKEKQNIFYDQPYYGIGAGMRTRNENLIFGTIELKGTFYPRVEEGSHFKISVRSNLRIKYSGSLVQRPSFIKYN